MLRFGADVHCRLFRLEIANVLHHASLWAEIAGAVVDVRAIADKQLSASTLHTFDLGVALATHADPGGYLADLRGYLTRILPPQYDVAIEADHVHVEWDARRKPPALDPGYEPPLPPA